MSQRGRPDSREHPYAHLPDTAYWARTVAGVAPHEVDPVAGVPFRIAREDKVATAGSCFAQHIARHLQRQGFNYFVSESAHPLVPADIAATFGYGTFSARYGNVYTARQLLQLFRRALGTFAPREDAWEEPGGSWIDPFRPRIQPLGFRSRAELLADRAQHLAAVRRMLAELDVFVFTLGLTEAWLAREDGAVFPLCPGVAGGVFDDARHVFHNFTATETAADLLAAIDLLREANPRARVVLTVSPVPLVATAAGRHVLAATTYSKAALRVAAEEVAAARDAVAYFPSYEIITGGHARGRYFAPDLRSVTEAGVAHVMRVFLRHFAQVDVGGGTGRDERAAPTPAACASQGTTDAHTAEMERLVQVDCDEEALGRAAGPATDAGSIPPATGHSG